MPSITYIPPLRDGACGTTLRTQQQPAMSAFRHELASMWRVLPGLCRGLLLARPEKPPMSWAEAAGMALRVVLACFEMAVLMVAVPVWMVLPGGMFAVWLGGCAGVVWGMCWVLNGREQVFVCNAASSGGWMMGQEGEDEKWLFVGGMGMRLVFSFGCSQGLGFG